MIFWVVLFLGDLGDVSICEFVFNFVVIFILEVVLDLEIVFLGGHHLCMSVCHTCECATPPLLIMTRWNYVGLGVPTVL